MKIIYVVIALILITICELNKKNSAKILFWNKCFLNGENIMRVLSTYSVHGIIKSKEIGQDPVC